MKYVRNGYVLDKESLRILRLHGVRYVVQSVNSSGATEDMVMKQTFFGYGATLADTGYVVVGVDEHDRYLLADAAVWAELHREGLAKKEAAVYDDGPSADARVGLSSREEDNLLICSPRADSDNHVFVDDVSVAAGI